ncbi:CHASE3 domain-containing protein [Agrobacterium sp. rho-13.3]|uniref:CHASE3 domain-containing protein n=1 Tax=Agrobacterium sp. rho-13.3 TaxID=3072980 RepID=UPI002A1707A4|nr:CHASE3 domain-containing protein [Agrobacterium sp. rho-13.3]MDX8311718.1 CHASE3 domain-containing protein [Agrobacterium sp. rho-13.3]
MKQAWVHFRRTYLTTSVMLRSIPVGVVIAAGVVATSWTHILLSDHQQLVVQTYEAIDTTKDVLIGLIDAETGQRGYLLSGDRRYLEPYDKALTRLTQLRTTLRTEIVGSADKVALVKELDTLVDGKLGELKASIDLHDTVSPDAAREREIAMMQRPTMDQIRRTIGQITETEKGLLSSRQSEVDLDETRIRVVAILVGLASFLTRAVIEMYIARLRKRREASDQSRKPLEN